MNTPRKLTARDIEFIEKNYANFTPTALANLLGADVPIVAYYINKFKNKDEEIKEIEEMKIKKENFKRPKAVYSNQDWNDMSKIGINLNYKSSY